MNKRIIDWQGMKNGIGKGRMGEQGSVACFVVCFLPCLALPGLFYLAHNAAYEQCRVSTESRVELATVALCGEHLI